MEEGREIDCGLMAAKVNIVMSDQFSTDRFLRILPVSSRGEFSDRYLPHLVTSLLEGNKSSLVRLAQLRKHRENKEVKINHRKKNCASGLSLKLFLLMLLLLL